MDAATALAWSDTLPRFVVLGGAGALAVVVGRQMLRAHRTFRRWQAKREFDRIAEQRVIIIDADTLALWDMRHGDRQWSLRWDDIDVIVAFKRDRWAIDDVCLGFRTRGDATYTVCDEDMPGWPQLNAELAKRFGVVQEEWWEGVDRVPFAENWTVLWTRAVTEHATLPTSWARCWAGLGARGDGRAFMQKIVAAYAEPHRKYHTVRHLTECIALMEQHLDLAVEPAEVEIALWFHDALYDVKANDNEAKSAEAAERELLEAGVAPDRVARVKQHILATRHAALPEGQDQMLLVDIDLAILGALRDRFVEYEQQVRAEYAWVPDEMFREKRRGIMAEFLARRPIFNTPRLREALEERARDNLAYSLRQLDS